MLDALFAAFPALARLEADARPLLAQGLREACLPAGSVLFADGGACQGFLLLLDGCVRVQKVAETGREIVLYRVEPGQTCVLTTNCLLADDRYGAEGIAETPLRGLMLAPSAFESLLARSAVFRRFVFSAYGSRISDLLMLIEEVAFGRIDVRLSHLLATRADGLGVVCATHHDLAVELGTAREVVSRQLKDFERRGWVTLARGRLRVDDRAALRGLSSATEEHRRGLA
jgi:CRP/FNR family transcriptional regulator